MKFVPEIRLAQSRDLHHLRDLDVKCFDFCWAEDDWEALGNKSSMVLVACVYGTPVAMLVSDIQEFKGQKLLHIYKVCVRPRFRGHNLGKKLLAKVYEAAREADADMLAISVPESMTNPDSSTNCVGWLTTMGFTADCILDEKAILYGQEEDIILFVFKTIFPWYPQN